MNLLRPLISGVIAVTLAIAGYFVGVEISIWAARTHPVDGWKPWYVGSGRHTSIRKELVPDTFGAIRLVGISSTTNIWDSSMGRGPIELKKGLFYRCACRLRSPEKNPVMISVFDAAPPHANRGLERCFTPSATWQNYEFTFRANETCNASISLFVGAKSINVDVAKLDIQPMEVNSENQSLGGISNSSEITSGDDWTMFPPVNNGSTLIKGDDTRWSFHRTSRQVERSAVDSLAYSIPTIPNLSQFELNLDISSSDASEVEVWFVSNNEESSPHEIIPIGQTQESIQLPIFLKQASDGGKVFLRGTSNDYVLKVSKLWIGSSSSTAGEQVLDVRRLKLIKDDGVDAKITRIADADKSIAISTNGDGTKVVRLEEPLSINAGSSGEILVDVKSERKRKFRVVLAEDHEPWNAIGDPRDFEINQEWQTVSLPFRTTVDEPNARVVVSFEDAAGTVNLSKLQMILSGTGTGNGKPSP